MQTQVVQAGGVRLTPSCSLYQAQYSVMSLSTATPAQDVCPAGAWAQVRGLQGLHSPHVLLTAKLATYQLSACFCRSPEAAQGPSVQDRGVPQPQYASANCDHDELLQHLSWQET